MNLLKKAIVVVALLAVCLLLASCALQGVLTSPFSADKSGSLAVDSDADKVFPSAAAETPPPTPSPTPSPVSVLGVSYPWDTTSLTLNLTSADIPQALSALSSFPNLGQLTIPEDAGNLSSFTADDFIALSKALPKTEIDCTFDLFGQRVNTVTTTRLEYLQTPIGDFGFDIFWKLLPYLHHLSYLSFDRCDIPDEACANLRY